MYNTTNAFFDTMRDLYNENQSLQHFACRASQKETFSTNPISAFIYLFFIYNSIYQIDWDASSGIGHNLVYHASMADEEQQKTLMKFIGGEEYSTKMFLQAFQPLHDMNIKGDWIHVTEDKPVWADDKRISKENGAQFFANLNHIQKIFAREDQSIDRILDLVGQCRGYVYKVRCNIFHGRKTLLEVKEENQKKRIEVYVLFLSCFLSWFFSVAEVKLDLAEIED